MSAQFVTPAVSRGELESCLITRALRGIVGKTVRYAKLIAAEGGDGAVWREGRGKRRKR
jgi:hypothetical protein